MNTFDAIHARRAVKHYDAAHKISSDEEAKLNDAIRQSPTSFNIQNWRFVIARDPDLRKNLRAAAWDQAQVTDGSLLYIICADLKAWDKDPARYMVNYPKELSDMYVPMIRNFYDGREWQQRDEAMRSAGIAAQTLMLAAKAMGYDACPMIGFDPQKVAELINLPDDHVVCMMVAVGKGIRPPREKGGYLPNEEIFLTDGF